MTLRRARLARSCAIGGKDVVGEVKGVDRPPVYIMISREGERDVITQLGENRKGQ